MFEFVYLHLAQSKRILLKAGVTELGAYTPEMCCCTWMRSVSSDHAGATSSHAKDLDSTKMVCADVVTAWSWVHGVRW